MKRIEVWALDDTDREIIALYQEDARRAYADIGSHVNLSAPAVRRRVQKLIDAGVIEFTLAVSSDWLSRGETNAAFTRPLTRERWLARLAERKIIPESLLWGEKPPTLVVPSETESPPSTQHTHD